MGLWIHWNCEWGMGGDGCAHGINFINFWQQINSTKTSQGSPLLAISPMHLNMHQDTTKKVLGHGMRWLRLAHPKGGTVVQCSGSKPPQPALAKSWKFTSGGSLGLWIHWNCEWGMGGDGCAHGINFINFWQWINPTKTGQVGPHLAISPTHPNMHQDTTKKASGHGMRWLRLAHPKGGTVVLCSRSKPPWPALAKSWKFTSGGSLGLWIHWNCEWGMGGDGCAHDIDFIDFWLTN